MYGLKVRIRCVIAETQPQTVECMMTDFDGQTHYFHGPLPVFTQESAPMIPGDGVIRCTVLREGAKFAEIDTSIPDDAASVMGETRFRVVPGDLVDNA